jgi:hypothetical protein
LEEDPQGGSQHVLQLLETCFHPLLLTLDAVLDKRLVRTLVQCLVATIRLRTNPQALWMSELGASLEGYEGSSSSAAAGTKRIGKLLRSVTWTVGLLDHVFLETADEAVQQLKAQGKQLLCMWDGSVVEKAESEKLEGLCPVLSRKAKRRGRTRRGLIFNWPAVRPVRVMGMQWTAGVIVGMTGLPSLAVTRWWSTKGVFATRGRDIEEEALRVVVSTWGSLVVHVCDRGYASGPWLQVLATYRARFVIRWIKTHLFLTSEGVEKKRWESGRGKRDLAHKEIRDPGGVSVSCDLWWTPLSHPASLERLFLVKARVTQGVMSLMTTEPVWTEAHAWEVFFPSRRRWQSETSVRSATCEWALECPRLWSLEARVTLLGMVMLVSAFLLSLRDPQHHALVEALLRFTCHRTGKRCKGFFAPLSRLRWALRRLWNDHRPRLTCFIPASLDPFAGASLLRDLEQFQKNWG